MTEIAAGFPGTISLCMIVKNEEKTIGRCLDSIQDIVDEIIIVDTGSTDATKDIVSRYTDKLYAFEWINNFAAARNFSFSLATKDYIMWLDADDVLLPEDKNKLIASLAVLTPDVDTVSMYYNLILDSQGQAVSRLRRNRIVKREKRFQWVGAVHEYLAVFGKGMNSDAAITHLPVEHDADRNLQIYEQRLQKGETFTPRDLYYFANELLDHRMFDRAVEFYQKFLATKQGWVEDNIAACGKLADCFFNLNDTESQLKYIFQSFLYDTPRADFCCRLGYYHLQLNQLNQAVFWYNLATKIEKPANTWSLMNSSCWTWLPHLQLCVCYYRLGNYRLSYDHNEKAAQFLPDDSRVKYNRELLSKLVPGFTSVQTASEPEADKTAIAADFKPITSIVILTYNNLQYTKLCIDSIRQYTDSASYEMIVVDNHSTDGTAEWLNQQSDIKTVINEENLGFPKACNQGIILAQGDSVLLLNNDTVVTPNWLSNLRTCLFSSEKIGAVGAVTNSCSNFQIVPYQYNTIDQMIEIAKQHNHSNSSLWEDRLRLVGFCLLIKRDVIDKIGLLDERFSPGNYEDDDYCMRMHTAGYRLVLCKDTYIHHYGSTSFKQQPQSFNNLLSKNAKLFENKWGFNLIYSTYVRREIIQLIDAPIDSPINVLEIGCACGGTLLQIKNQFKNANIYGVEINANAAAIAKNFAHIIACDIEKEPLEITESYFDYLIFADVLEHFKDPWTVLNRLVPYLRPDGYILASIPNVAHCSVIRGLAQGRWAYEEAGLLDRTHLRFFTRQEIDALFKNIGFPRITYATTNIPVNDEETAFMNCLLSCAGENMRPEYLAYQYIVKASRSAN